MPATTKSRGTKKAAPVAASAKGNTQLQEFFLEALKDIYWAEKRLTRALPKLQKAATTQELKNAIEEHLGQTQEHVSRIEEAFQMMGKKAQAKKCEAMEGLVKESESVLEETEKGSMTRDAGIIASAQKVEHYEIATYGTLVTLAKTMGEDDVAELLSQTLEEEKQTDQTLTGIAENGINWSAEEEEEGEEEEGGEEEEE
jgi:ferritin-like metal-binding protein YciE